MNYCYCCHGRLYHAADCPERFGVDDDETELEETMNASMESTVFLSDDAAEVPVEVHRFECPDHRTIITMKIGHYPASVTFHAPTLSALFNLGAAIQDQVAALGGGKLHENVQAEHMLDAAPIDYAELGTGD